MSKFKFEENKWYTRLNESDVPPAGCVVRCEFRDGVRSRVADNESELRWDWQNKYDDIVKFKIAMLPEETDTPDPGAHYRYGYTRKLTAEEIEQGEVTIKLDPYRVCAIYGTGGGPREHIAKKALRGTSKGHSERELIAELRSCLDRWEEMLDEDGVS